MGDTNTTKTLARKGVAQYPYIKMTPFMQGHPKVQIAT